MKFYPYGKQHIDDDDINAVVAALRSDFITQGPAVHDFEKALAEVCHARYAVVFNSGTSAQHAAYAALGLKPGDELITSPNTFVATANAGLYLGAKAIFADVEPETGNIDVEGLEALITEKTRMIAPVHYAGHPANLEKIAALAQKYNLSVVEDGCHALGAQYQGKPIGSCKYSDMTMFSFHPVKHITSGEGGALLTNNEGLYKAAAQFRTHGIAKETFVNPSHGDWYYEMQELGYNYRMNDLQASLGLSQLKKLPGFISRRREIAKQYQELFRNNPYFDLPVERDYATSAYHLFFILLKASYADRRAEIFSRLRERGLGVQVHYIPVYQQPYYQAHGYKDVKCPHAENFYRREISIPMYPQLENEDLLEIRDRIFSVFEEFSR